MINEAIKEKVRSLGLNFVSAPSPTQAMVELKGDQLVQVSGGACGGTSCGTGAKRKK